MITLMVVDAGIDAIIGEKRITVGNRPYHQQSQTATGILTIEGTRTSPDSTSKLNFQQGLTESAFPEVKAFHGTDFPKVVTNAHW
jgi:hypothetical protein